MARSKLDPSLAPLGQRLRALREARGLTQQEVGDKANFTAKYVSEIERGLRDPPLSTLRRIAERGLGVTLQDAVDGVSVEKAGTSVAAERQDRQMLPHLIEAAAQEIAGLPHDERRKIMALLRGLLDLAR